jgi:Tfp pilus assembly protein PilX
MHTSWRQRVQRGHRVSARALQRGFSLVTVALVLGVVALALVGVSRYAVSASSRSAGLNMGSVFNEIAKGVNQYRSANLIALTSATPTIAGFASPMAPTIAELKTAGYISTNLSSTFGEFGTYNVRIFTTPSGCVGPSSTCNVYSVLWPTNPVTDPTTGKPDVVRLSALISQLTEESGSYSTATTPGSITGGNGGWSITNPDSTQRAGILVAVAGLGGSGFPYLVVGDTRNPDFQNLVSGSAFNTPTNQTIGGACTTNGSFGTASTGIAYCYNNIWVLYDSQQATAGAACTGVDGTHGQAANGAGLICISSKWRDEVTYGFRGEAYYSNGQTAAQPTCGAGLLPKAVVSAVSASVIIGTNNPGNNTGSFQAVINSSTWKVTITGSDGSTAGTNAQALVTTFCATS